MKCPGCGIALAIVQADEPAHETEKPGGSPPPENVAEVLEHLLGRIDDESLDGREGEFVAGVRERFDRYGAKTFLSEKQRAWLEDLASREPAAASARGGPATDDDIPF